MKSLLDYCRWIASSLRTAAVNLSRPQSRSAYLVFELVLLLVLRLVEVDEVVCDPVSASALHVPADLEGIAGDPTDPDLLRNRQVVHVPDAAVC